MREVLVAVLAFCGLISPPLFVMFMAAFGGPGWDDESFLYLGCIFGIALCALAIGVLLV